MTFDELLDELPNALHDAALSKIEVSYSEREAAFHMTVDVTEDGSAGWVRDLKVTLTGVALFVIDPPDPRYPSNQAKPLWIDAGSGQPSTSEVTLPDLSAGTTLNWIYVNEWNSFIRFATEGCRYEWTSERQSR